jgi:hypothetical protein
VKRQYFDISLNGAVVATTFAWNSAIRKIERLVRERSLSVAEESKKDAVYKLVESDTSGPDKWHFTHGHRTWQSPHETLRYDIKLRGSIPTC